MRIIEITVYTDKKIQERQFEPVTKFVSGKAELHEGTLEEFCKAFYELSNKQDELIEEWVKSKEKD